MNRLCQLNLHHGGKFINFPEIDYVGGQIEHYPEVDVDYFNMGALEGFALTYEYHPECKAYFKTNGRDFGNGVRILFDDNSIIEMINTCFPYGRIDLYVDHTLMENLDQTEITMEQNSIGSNVGENAEKDETPTKKKGKKGKRKGKGKGKGNTKRTTKNSETTARIQRNLVVEIGNSDEDLVEGHLTECSDEELVEVRRKHKEFKEQLNREIEEEEAGLINPAIKEAIFSDGNEDNGHDAELENDHQNDADVEDNGQNAENDQGLNEESVDRSKCGEKKKAKTKKDLYAEWNIEDENVDEEDNSDWHSSGYSSDNVMKSLDESSEEDEKVCYVGPPPKKHKKQRHSVFNPKTKKQDIKFTVGMTFSSVRALINAIRDYSIAQGRKLWYSVNDNKRCHVKCVTGCPWKLWASYMQGCDTWQVKTILDIHNCILNFKNKLANTKFFAEYYGNRIRRNPSWKLKEMQEEIKEKFNLDVSEVKCMRVR